MIPWPLCLMLLAGCWMVAILARGDLHFDPFDFLWWAWILVQALLAVLAGYVYGVKKGRK